MDDLPIYQPTKYPTSDILKSAIKERGQEWIRTTEVERQRIYSPPHLAALEPALLKVFPPLYASIEPLVGIEPTTY